CHFVDLLRFLADSPIIDCGGIKLSQNGTITDDKTTVWLRFEDGSFGNIHYLANGHKSFPKERLEIFCEGKILQLDNFQKLRGFGWERFSKMNLWSQNKGYEKEIELVVDSMQKGIVAPISFEEIIEVSRNTITAYERTLS
ncbi:dehydrogenase, partial [Verrucomicrobia bacterium]|nr:dehydrogenase [Verrucomicrobiota bacterium]